ncbi:MAG: urease accessory protein UreD [Limnobacter sp.]|nr:urease accessory protein UreD [Limnobacter sp.]
MGSIWNPGSVWKAGLKIGLTCKATSPGEPPKTVISSVVHKGPLYVQKAFYPEGPELAHVYPLHPPGGLVSGDELTVQLDVGNKAQALMTTPGAARVYRARPDRTLQRQINVFNLGVDSSLEWLPLETIVYPDAQASLNTAVHLQEGSKLMLWEVCSLGLPASLQAFDLGSLKQTLNIYAQGRLLLRERLVMDESTRSGFELPVGFQGKPVTGLYVAGPFHLGQLVSQPGSGGLAQLLDDLREIPVEPSLKTSMTEVGGFILVRTLGSCSELSKRWMIEVWKILRPALLGRIACPPRVWRT